MELIDEEFDPAFSSSIRRIFKNPSEGDFCREHKVRLVDKNLFNCTSSLRLTNNLPVEQSPFDTSKIKYSMVGRGHVRTFTTLNKIVRDKCFSINHIRVCDNSHREIVNNYCLAWDCPRCWPLAAMRASLKMRERIDCIQSYYQKKTLWNHFTFSPPQDSSHEIIDNYQALSKQLKNGKLKLYRGCVAFRHFHRLKFREGQPFEWKWGPHFHIITDSPYYDNTHWKESDWVVKKLPAVTLDPLALELYELGHSGFIYGSDKRNTMYRYYGRFGYNQWTRHETIQQEKDPCPCCLQDRAAIRPTVYTDHSLILGLDNEKRCLSSLSTETRFGSSYDYLAETTTKKQKINTYTPSQYNRIPR